MRAFSAAAAMAVLAGWLPVSRPPDSRPAAGAGIAALVRSGPPWPSDRVDTLIRDLLGDPSRFASDSEFRARRMKVLPSACPEGTPAALREMILFGFWRDGRIPFDDFERVQEGWRAVPRTSAARRDRYPVGRWRFASDEQGALEASVFSLPFAYADRAAGERFIAGVRRVDPDRTLLVFVDPPGRIEMESFLEKERVVVLDTFGREYTPWTRDTFSLVRDGEDRVRVLVRPPSLLQESRASDNTMGRELVKDLPDALDTAWGRPRWAESPVPFHNGQVILTRTAALLSIHTIEPRILQLLGLQSVPVASFERPAGVARYVAAARVAAGELSSLYGRAVKFVHPLPATGAAASQKAAMDRIGGGAGFDLDSLLTVVEREDGGEEALVADVEKGRDLLRQAAGDHLEAFRSEFRLTPGAARLREILLAYSMSSRPARLGSFLDLIAEELAAKGYRVRRMPFLLVPDSIVAESENLSAQDFQISWNNVVVEVRGGRRRAEGFSNALAEGDAAAAAAFRECGYRMDFIPPLAASILHNGGYRCASNHLRSPDAFSRPRRSGAR